MAGKKVIPETPEERQARLAALDEEIRQVELETKLIQLEQAKRSNENFVIDDATRKRVAEQAQRNLRIEATAHQALMAACSHAQGGFGQEDMYTGDGKPSLVTTELPVAGMKMIICTRCLGKWVTPDIHLKKDDPEKYAEQLAEWRDILKLERASLSKPLGCPAFGFTTDEGAPAMPTIQ